MTQSDTLWIIAHISYWALVFPYVRSLVFGLSFVGYIKSRTVWFMMAWGLGIGALTAFLELESAVFFVLMVLCSTAGFFFRSSR